MAAINREQKIFFISVLFGLKLNKQISDSEVTPRRHFINIWVNVFRGDLFMPETKAKYFEVILKHKQEGTKRINPVVIFFYLIQQKPTPQWEWIMC